MRIDIDAKLKEVDSEIQNHDGKVSKQTIHLIKLQTALNLLDNILNEDEKPKSIQGFTIDRVKEIFKARLGNKENIRQKISEKNLNNYIDTKIENLIKKDLVSQTELENAYNYCYKELSGVVNTEGLKQ